MSTDTAFTRQVKDALANLYDPVHLQVHPLTEQLRFKRLPGQTVGEALRKLLWDTVETLKPPASVPSHRPEWLSYRLLWLHYIQLLDQTSVERDLGLSERTFYRRLQEAVEAVASVLWEGHRLSEREPAASEPPLSGSPAELARQKALRLVQDGRRQVVSLHDAVSAAVETVLPLFEQQATSLALDIPGDLPKTCGDPAVLHQVLVNTLLGGLEVVAPGRIELHVALSGGKAVWRVSGLGSDWSDDALRTLGPIALSRELVAHCGGELWVERGEGGASALILTIPCVQPTTVLIIDDDADARHLLSRILSGYGYAVHESSSAEGVPDLVLDRSADAILLDVLMPQQDGWRLLQRLKMQEETASIPVIICSVLSQPSLATALGAAAVVQKPISEEALLRTVEQVLAAYGRAAPPADRSETRI